MTEDRDQIMPAVGTCPECGHALRGVTDGESTNFLCATCCCCWHVELGWISRVDPATCPGCSLREVCEVAVRPYASGARRS